MERKLASIRRIDEIRPIEGADFIEVAVVGGWTVIVKKDEYKAGDLAAYFEIDGFIPTTIFSFLSNGKAPKEYNGIKGERLRSKKMRGVISQGLLLGLDILDAVGNLEGGATIVGGDLNGKIINIVEGENLTEVLGIQKWEKPIPAQLRGIAKGNFPTHICPRTDAERVQNLTNRIQDWKDRDLKFFVDEKLDGTSFTYVRFKPNDETYESHVCSRNLSLEETDGNLYWQIARKYDIINKVETLGLNIAIQGEIIGNNIQGNQYKLNAPELFVFNIYDIDKQGYVNPIRRKELCDQLGLKHVPIINEEMSIRDFSNIEEMLQFAEGKSIINGSEREGVVFKCTTDNTLMFKIVSNKWLLRYE